MIILQLEEPNGERRIIHIAADRATLGRGRECDVRLEHETVSKLHAEIVNQGGALYVLRDLGSYNGTYLNERWITESRLATNDRIRIGRYALTFLSPDVAPGSLPILVPEAAPAPPKPPRTVRKLRALLCVGIAVACTVAAAALLSEKDESSRETPPAASPSIDHASDEKPERPPAEAPGPSPEEPPATRREQAPEQPPRPAPRRTEPVRIPAIPPPPPWLARLRDEVEPLLVARCLRCHDGSRGTRYVIAGGGAPEPLRLRLTAAALSPFIYPTESGIPFLLAHVTSTAHGGGAEVLSAQEASILSRFLADPAVRDAARGPGFWTERPPFRVERLAIAPERERLLRFVYLDLVARPPTEDELAEHATRPADEVVGELMRSPQSRRSGGGADAKRLAAEYAAAAAGPPRTRKTPEQHAASLLVDLWSAIPTDGDRAALAAAIGFEAETFPLVAFLLGPVELPPDRDAWIERVFVRFLGRPPAAEERDEARAILDRDGGPRGLIAGLASTEAYASY